MRISPHLQKPLLCDPSNGWLTSSLSNLKNQNIFCLFSFQLSWWCWSFVFSHSKLLTNYLNIFQIRELLKLENRGWGKPYTSPTPTRISYGMYKRTTRGLWRKLASQRLKGRPFCVQIIVFFRINLSKPKGEFIFSIAFGICIKLQKYP